MPTSERRDKDYEKLGRMLIDFENSGIHPGKGYYRAAFLRGLVGGFGGVIGATILVALLLWVLSFFHSIPLIGDFVETIRNTITNSTK